MEGWRFEVSKSTWDAQREPCQEGALRVRGGGTKVGVGYDVCPDER